ncbi:LexA family protein [Gordonibacter urolithinfaciens]|jgi:repressor LexA|uniref:LexA family protein n=1 Tax=Gordonibacter urolithinfaciens TaxID=1335613 RepID=UPI002057D5E8|nr:MAG TPA: Repressor protein CI [Caudoviricetes sp.]
MGVAENIKMIRDMFDVTQRELADIAGVTENAVSKWENGYSEPRMGAVERIAACYGLKKRHIIEDGGMDLIDPITKRPKILNDYPQGAIIPSPPRRAYAPLLGRVHAGDAQTPEIIEDNVSLPYEVWDKHRDGYFLEVEGNCMSKVYPEGCFIFVDPRMEPKNGSIAVVSIDGEDYVMRRLYRGANTMILSPDSWEDGYEDIVISEGDDRTVEFEGVVVWFQASKEME